MGAGDPPGRAGWLREERSVGMPAFRPEQRWADALAGYVRVLHSGYTSEQHEAALGVTDFLARAFPVRRNGLLVLASRMRALGAKDLPEDFQALLSGWAHEEGLADPAVHEQHYASCVSGPCTFWTVLHTVLAAIAARGLSGDELKIPGEPPL